MRTVTRIGLAAALALSLAGSGQTQSATPTVSSQQGIHGTIVIVVETKDGFVLVGDSRGMNLEGQRLPDEYQKVFSIGKRSGVVIAGLIASTSGEISDSVATHLIFADHMATTSFSRLSLLADFASQSVFDAIREEADLLDGDKPVGSPIAAFSAVSVDEEGHHEWITMVLSPVIRMDPFTRKEVNVKIQEIKPAPISKVMALGSVARTVNELVNAHSPIIDNFRSQSAIMQRYYLLKRLGQLAELSLEEGEELAQCLIKAAIDTARPGDGVGGSVDVLTITKEGVNWVRKKDVVATPPPMYSIRVSGSGLAGQIDGIDCVRCTVPPNARLLFRGKREARVAQARFTGPCEFLLGSNARELMPETSDKLTAVFSIWCDVFTENSAGEVTKLSSATKVGQPAVSIPDYSSLCDLDLKAEALDTVEKLRVIMAAYSVTEGRFESEKMSILLGALDTQRKRVQLFEYQLLSNERYADLMDLYTVQYSAKVKALRIELSGRLHVAPGKGIGLNTAAVTSQIYEWIGDLENLANQLPASR